MCACVCAGAIDGRAAMAARAHSGVTAGESSAMATATAMAHELEEGAVRRGRRRGRRCIGGGGDLLCLWSKRQRSRGKLKKFQVVYIYAEAFSPGWSHQPGLKVNFGQAKRREARPLVPVGGSNHD